MGNISSYFHIFLGFTICLIHTSLFTKGTIEFDDIPCVSLNRTKQISPACCWIDPWWSMLKVHLENMIYTVSLDSQNNLKPYCLSKFSWDTGDGAFIVSVYSRCFVFSGVVDDKMSVLLYDTTGSQDVCINQFLVQHGYCQTAGLGYDCYTLHSFLLNVLKIIQIYFGCKCVAALGDWLKLKLLPPTQPIRHKIKTYHDLITCIFPRLAPVTCIWFEFFLFYFMYLFFTYYYFFVFIWSDLWL